MSPVKNCFPVCDAGGKHWNLWKVEPTERHWERTLGQTLSFTPHPVSLDLPILWYFIQMASHNTWPSVDHFLPPGFLSLVIKRPPETRQAERKSRLSPHCRPPFHCSRWEGSVYSIGYSCCLKGRNNISWTVDPLRREWGGELQPRLIDSNGNST